MNKCVVHIRVLSCQSFIGMPLPFRNMGAMNMITLSLAHTVASDWLNEKAMSNLQLQQPLNHDQPPYNTPSRHWKWMAATEWKVLNYFLTCTEMVMEVKWHLATYNCVQLWLVVWHGETILRQPDLHWTHCSYLDDIRFARYLPIELYRAFVNPAKPIEYIYFPQYAYIRYLNSIDNGKSCNITVNREQHEII